MSDLASHLHETAGVWDSNVGAFISENHKTLATVIAETYPSMSLIFVPPKARSLQDGTMQKPYAIVDRPAGKPIHVVKWLSDDDMRDPARVLGDLWAGDIIRQKPEAVIQAMEARQLAHKMMQAREEEARAEEARDMVAFALDTFRSGHTFTLREGGQKLRK